MHSSTQIGLCLRPVGEDFGSQKTRTNNHTLDQSFFYDFAMLVIVLCPPEGATSEGRRDQSSFYDLYHDFPAAIAH